MNLDDLRAEILKYGYDPNGLDGRMKFRITVDRLEHGYSVQVEHKKHQPGYVEANDLWTALSMCVPYMAAVVHPNPLESALEQILGE